MLLTCWLCLLPLTNQHTIKYYCAPLAFQKNLEYVFVLCKRNFRIATKYANPLRKIFRQPFF